LGSNSPKRSDLLPVTGKGKDQGKSIPLHAWTGHWDCRRLEFRESPDNRHMKVAILSALSTGCLHQPFVLQSTPGP